MKVSELIEHLKTFPQDLDVAYSRCSEQVLMKETEIGLYKACKARADGWIQNERPDMERVDYVLFPGN